MKTSLNPRKSQMCSLASERMLAMTRVTSPKTGYPAPYHLFIYVFICVCIHLYACSMHLYACLMHLYAFSMHVYGCLSIYRCFGYSMRFWHVFEHFPRCCHCHMRVCFPTTKTQSQFRIIEFTFGKLWFEQMLTTYCCHYFFTPKVQKPIQSQCNSCW